MRDGDLLMFVDWRGDPAERLTETPDTQIGKVYAARPGAASMFAESGSQDADPPRQR